MRTVTSMAVFALVCLTVISAKAERGDRSIDRPRREYKPEIVKWIGEVKDESSHTTEHEHELTFVRQEDGKEFDVVDSPEIVKLHHETDKNYLVEIEAEKTPKFLFWGGNLIVKNFKVIRETSEPIALKNPVARRNHTTFSHGRM